MRFGILTCLAICFFSCSNGSNVVVNRDIDEFIAKYNDVEFDQLKDISIAQRSRNAGSVVYVIGKGQGDLPVYFATFDLQRREITAIDKINLEKSKTPDYLTKDEISNAITAIRKYDFYFFAVDSFENVYINPFYADEPPYFLRLKTFTGDSTIKKGFVYEVYKNKWYLNKTRRGN